MEKNFRKILIIFCFISIFFSNFAISQTTKSSNQPDAAYGAINPEYRPSDSPFLRLPEDKKGWKPIIPPKPKEVGEVDDPTALEIYNIATGEVIHIKSDNISQQPVDLGLSLIPEYQGLLPPGIVPKTVFPPDDRVRITPTTPYPWRTICKLFVTFPDGATGGCSGAIIDDFHVLTAGHCIYSHDHGGWATSIEFVPGLDGDYMPYNHAWSTYLRSYAGWTQYQMQEHDWGVVTLDRNIGNYVGWMGRQTAQASNQIYTGMLNLAGYPGDLSNGLCLYCDSDYGRIATQYNHWYYIDTYNGQSGSPVWRYYNDNRYILTIHAYGDDGSSSNHGTRLDQDKFDRIITWTESDTPPSDYADLIDDGQDWSGFSPTTVTPGVTNFSVWCDVRNIGTASSGGFYVSYYASENTTITPSDHLIGTDYVSSISPFNWEDSEWSGTFPSSIPADTYYVGWIIDSGNDVQEFEETNNTAYKDSYQLTVNISPPNNVSASDGTYTDKVRITWDGVTGASHYRVWRNTSNNSGSATSLGSWQSSTYYNDTSSTPGTTYYYWVKASTNSSGSNPSVFSSSDSGYRALTSPTNVSATDGTYTDKVRITWNSVTGASHYRVYRNTSNNSGSATSLGSWQSSTYYNDTSSTPGTTYYYWVKASTNSSGSNPSDFSSSDTGWRKLSAPTNVSATDGTYTDKVRITWSSVTGANYYHVYRNTSNNSGSATSLGSWQSNTYYDDTSSATPGTTYYYWVKAATSSSGSNPSDFSSSDTGWRKLSAPTNVSATDGTYTDKVKITWNGVTGASHYRVWRNTSNNSITSSPISSWQSSTSYDDTSATPGTTYYYWVKASTNSSGSNPSDFSSSDTGWRKLSAPTNVSATYGTYTDKVMITWDSVTGASYYHVYRNTSNNSGSATSLGNWQNSTSYDDISATPGTTYYYWVKASTSSSGSNPSDFSSSDTGWRKLSPPTNVSASDGTYTDKVRITWSSVTGASHYGIYRNTSNNSSVASLISSWQSSTYYNDTSATPGTTYYYWLKAATSSSGSNPSDFSSSDTGWRKLSPPTNVLATDGTYTDKVRITCSSVTGASCYNVYRNTINDTTSSSSISSWQSSTSYDDNSANPGTTYYYWVKAATSSSGSSPSDFSSSDTGWIKLSPPTNVSATDGTYTGKIKITWSSVTGASHYRVWRNTINDTTSSSFISSWQSSTSYNDNSATPGTTYWYWVKAATSSSGLRPSDFSTSDTGWIKLSLPTNVSATDGTYTDKVRITWSSVTGASYYHVYRNIINDTTSSSSISSWQSSTSYNDTSANSATTYYYWVKAATSSSGLRPSEYSYSNAGWRWSDDIPSEIWPGDTDNDALGIVNEEDIVPIGIYWDKTGLQRDSISFKWKGFTYPMNWSEPFAPFADCNGDGIVNITDVLAICLNWDRTHSPVLDNPFVPINIEPYRENFVEIYNSLGYSEIEITIRNYIATKFDLPIIEIVNKNYLEQSVPNPFNKDTEITFVLNDNVTYGEVKIFNVKGQLVKKFNIVDLKYGNNTIIWNGKDKSGNYMSSGIYFYQVETNDWKSKIKRMVLMR